MQDYRIDSYLQNVVRITKVNQLPFVEMIVDFMDVIKISHVVIKEASIAKLIEITKRIHLSIVCLSSMVGINYSDVELNKLFYKIMVKMDSMVMIFLLAVHSNKNVHYTLIDLKNVEVI